LTGATRLKYDARVESSSSSRRVGDSGWFSGGACGPPLALIRLIFAPLSSYWWKLHYGMIKKCFFFTTLKIRIYPKNSFVFYEQSSYTNFLWKKLLVVTLKHSNETCLTV
jgi:hypothetical protein